MGNCAVENRVMRGMPVPNSYIVQKLKISTPRAIRVLKFL